MTLASSLARCADCGPAANPAKGGPQLQDAGTTTAQATYKCPKCGLAHVVNLKPAKKGRK